MAKRDDYTYLQDAKKAACQHVNLFAAVKEIGSARRSRGTDYVLTLKIADPSYPAPGFSVNFFAEQPTKLPHVKSSGDIICLHRVTMKIHSGEVYCVFNKNSSSFALFEGKTGVGSVPYQTSAMFCCLDHDKDFILDLRQWLVTHQSDAVMKDYSLQLREIKIGPAFDLVCKVLHVGKISEDDWMLFVWDGTDTPPATFQMDLAVEWENPSPLHLEALPLSREVLCAFPCVGSILRVTSGKSFVKEISQLQAGGHWVRFCKITCELQSGLWKGLLQTFSKVRFLSDEDDTVLLRQRNYNDRISSKQERRPLTSFPRPSCITETEYEHVSYATLMDSLTHPKVTHKCKCVVRVVAAYPWRAEDLRCEVQGHYRFRLTLEDPTARIRAYVYAEDGVKFFNGYPSANVLTSKMNKLLGITISDGEEESSCASRDPPWVWCCLKSYYLDKNDPWGSRRYRVFGTEVVG